MKRASVYSPPPLHRQSGVKSLGVSELLLVAVVDIEPAGYFERSSENALLQFEFEPRIVNGEAVAVEGVQYLFRYHLQDDGQPNFNRPPPEARNRNND